MAYKYTISRAYIQRVANELEEQGIKVHKGLHNLDVESIRYNFSNLVRLAREDWLETTKEPKLPDKQYEILRRAFAEELVKASNLKPYSQQDWFNLLDKIAESYDKANIELSINNVIDSDIYFDIVNSIASKTASDLGNLGKFHDIKYTYVTEGKGNGKLNEDKFKSLLSDDDLFALGKLSETYLNSSGFLSDPLYIEIKERAVNAGRKLSKVEQSNINVVDKKPVGPVFTFDF